MSDGAKQSGWLLVLGGVGAAIVTGGVSYTAARLQSEAAIEAAIESRQEPLKAYIGNGGVWVLGSRDMKLVYCRLKPGELPERLDEGHLVDCTRPQFVGTY